MYVRYRMEDILDGVNPGTTYFRHHPAPEGHTRVLKRRSGMIKRTDVPILFLYEQ
jgi:hypothetical protein